MRSPFGWSYPPGCFGPPEYRIVWLMCKCGRSEEDHEIEDDRLLGCMESNCPKFEEAEREDEPVEDYDLLAKDEEL